MLNVAFHSYGTAASGVLRFVAQLEGPPVGHTRVEESALAGLLRVPFPVVAWAAFFNLDKVGAPQLQSAESTASVAQFRFAGRRSRHRWVPALARFRRLVEDARPLESMGKDSVTAPPLRREPLAWYLRRATRGWGSAPAVVSAATLPLLGTTSQSRVESASGPRFEDSGRARVFVGRFSRVVGVGRPPFTKSADIVWPLRGEAVAIAVQGTKRVCSTWTKSRTVRLPRTCFFFGCLHLDSTFRARCSSPQ